MSEDDKKRLEELYKEIEQFESTTKKMIEEVDKHLDFHFNELMDGIPYSAYLRMKLYKGLCIQYNPETQTLTICCDYSNFIINQNKDLDFYSKADKARYLEGFLYDTGDITK